MTQTSATPSHPTKRVFCVLSEEQRREYQQELERMRQPGLDFVFQSSPEHALDQIQAVKPSLVIVGMTIGVMEGIEFLALLLRRYKGFDKSVVVLPNKGDPFPPMLQRRDPSTGRSTTEETTPEAITELVRSLAPLPSTIAARELPASMRGPAAQESEMSDWESSFEGHLHDSTPGVVKAPAVPLTPAADSAADVRVGGGLQAGLRAAAPTRRAKWPFVVAAVAVLGVVAAGFFILGDGDEPAQSSDAAAMNDAAPAEPSQEDRASASAGSEKQEGAPAGAETKAAVVPSPAEAGAGDSTAQEADAAGASTASDAEHEQPAAAGGTALDLRQLVTLPLRFRIAKARFGVADRNELESIVAAFGDALKRDPSARMEIGGHASSEGSAVINRVLGRRRAISVRTYLVGLGIPAARIVLKSYGTSVPAVDPASSEEEGRNRRVTLRLVD